MLWLWMESQYLIEWLTTSLSGVTCTAVALCITAYQRYLSPYKGFCCAHRALHRQHSCSEFVKRAIMRRGLYRAVPLVRRRFAACKTASETLKQSTKPDRNPKSNTGGQSDCVSATCDACDYFTVPVDCATFCLDTSACDPGHLAACHCSPF